LNDSIFCKGLYDSGSNISIINKKLIETLNIKSYKVKNPEFKMVSGRGNVVGITKIKLKIFNLTKEVYVFVLDSPDFGHDFLIGLDLISEFKLCQNQNLKIYQNLKSGRQKPRYINSNVKCVNMCQFDESLTHLTPDQSLAIKNLIIEFNDAFAKNKFDVGGVKGHEATVKMSEHKYVSRKPYRCNIIDQKEIECQVNQLLEAGLIEESTSPFAAPVTLAFKKQSDGTKKKK